MRIAPQPGSSYQQPFELLAACHERVERMGAEDGGGSKQRRILVATDCLSEGINLQHLFTAVVHYDLAWNPTRHEQREGRVDRYGQRAAQGFIRK